MIKNYFVSLVLLLGVSCSRNGDDSSIPKKDNISLKISTTQDLSNLQVGEKLIVNFEIEDKDTINTTYVLRPETMSIRDHQRIDIDYLMQVEEGDENNKPKYKNVNKLSLKSHQQKGGFYLEVLQPGSFKHKYILEKYKNGVKEEETSMDFLFNAVKITAWTYSIETQTPNLFRHSIHRRLYKFIIDDGNQQYDNYLENVNGKKHTYNSLYIGQNHSEGDSEFSAHQEKEFRWSEEQEKSPPHIHSTTIKAISIQQKQADGTVNNIIYKDIPIEVR